MKYTTILPILLTSFFPIFNANATVAVENNQTVAFLGDSITQSGADSPAGYVRLIVSGLAANDIIVTPIPAGISGNNSANMLARLDADVLSKKPQWMTLSCGVNDVWHGDKGILLEPYKENITKLINQAQAAKVKVLLLTSTMIFEDQSQPMNQTLVAYNSFLRDIAKEKGCLLADVNESMQTFVAANIQAAGGKAPGNFLTVDGIHMNPLGNEMMAARVLETLGLNEAQMSKAKQVWLTFPASSAMDARAMITLQQVKQLSEVAHTRKLSLQALLAELLSNAITDAIEKK